LREARGSTSQDNLAAAAQDVGFRWSRTTVASIETGRRDVTAEELLAYPLVLAIANGEEVRPLPQLLGDRLSLSTEMELLDVGELLRPTESPARSEKLYSFRRPLRWFVTDGDWRLAIEKYRPFWPEASDEVLQKIVDDPAREAEHKAARRLGISPPEVMVLSHRLWGHGLTTEREKRLKAGPTQALAPREIQARRGAITRALLTDLTDVLQEVEE